MITYRGYNNPMYNAHKTWVCVIYGKIWYVLDPFWFKCTYLCRVPIISPKVQEYLYISDVIVLSNLTQNLSNSLPKWNSCFQTNSSFTYSRTVSNHYSLSLVLFQTISKWTRMLKEEPFLGRRSSTKAFVCAAFGLPDTGPCDLQ